MHHRTRVSTAEPLIRPLLEAAVPPVARRDNWRRRGSGARRVRRRPRVTSPWHGRGCFRGLRYSARSAIIGSTRVARRAGTIVATSDTTAMSAATAEYVDASLGLTPNSTA